MKVNFTYDKSKDVWCLLNKGRSSNNSSKPTKQYELLFERCGENSSEAEVASFIDTYIAENKINVDEYVNEFQSDWDKISADFHGRAQDIFNTELPKGITAFLTINSRCPYNIEEKFFFVSMQETQPRRVAMHELWHFYTWYGLGAEQKEQLGKEKYNKLKESLTVLLNVECSDIYSEGIFDTVTEWIADTTPDRVVKGVLVIEPEEIHEISL